MAENEEINHLVKAVQEKYSPYCSVYARTRARRGSVSTALVSLLVIPVVELLAAHIAALHAVERYFAHEPLVDEFHEVGLGRGGWDAKPLRQVANGEHLLPIFCKKREELGLTWVEAAAMEELGGLLLLILFVLKVGAQIAECLL